SAKTDLSRNESEITSQLDALRQALSQAQTKLDSQQQQIELLKQQLNGRQLEAASISDEEQRRRMIVASTHVTTSSFPPAVNTYPGANVGTESAHNEGQQKAVKPESPLSSFKIGDAVITPGGFVDFENVFRTTNTHNNIATAFAAIPFSNTTQGHVT